jgi:hypothetical protein
VAEAVIGGALLRIRERLIRLVEFLEMDFRVLVARVLVRVVFHRELAESGLELRIAGALFDPENFVIVAFGHGSERLAQTFGQDLRHPFVEHPRTFGALFTVEYPSPIEGLDLVFEIQGLHWAQATLGGK